MNILKFRPRIIRIMGRDFKVRFIKPDPLNECGSLGECKPLAFQIDIRDDQHPIEEADTLLHEAIHGIWYTMDIGLPQHEEFVVRKLATGLMQVFLDNPSFLKYLAAARNK